MNHGKEELSDQVGGDLSEGEMEGEMEGLG